MRERGGNEILRYPLLDPPSQLVWVTQLLQRDHRSCHLQAAYRVTLFANAYKQAPAERVRELGNVSTRLDIRSGLRLIDRLLEVEHIRLASNTDLNYRVEVTRGASALSKNNPALLGKNGPPRYSSFKEDWSD